MRIPIPERVIKRAKDYAAHSEGFTHDHPGWENKKSKTWRITFGKIAEYCIIDLLGINEKDITEDKTGYKENDSLDFIFRCKKYDVKTTYTKCMPVSITTVYEDKDIDYFIGTKIDFDCRFLEILGVIEKREAVNATYFLPHNAHVCGPYKVLYEKGAYYFTGTYDDFFTHFELSKSVDKEPVFVQGTFWDH